MSFAVTLRSGSTGNSTLLSDGSSHLLVDCGLSLRRLAMELSRFSLSPGQLSGVLLTHEHSDHTGALSAWSKLEVPVFASEGTLNQVHSRFKLRYENMYAVTEGRFLVGGITAAAFATSHDCMQSFGYTFELPGMKAGVCTDLGELTPGVISALTGCDYVVLECNHDIDMLKSGPYPLKLRRRILSRLGHLSNDDCAVAAVSLARTGTRRISLAHMSEENNDPAVAGGTVAWALSRAGFEPGRDIGVDIAPRYEPGLPYVPCDSPAAALI